MVDLAKLQTFIHTAEALSFSKAAKLMHLTQPTISHHIKTLENDLGVRLFDRSGNQLHLTEAGQVLLPWARKLIRQSMELEEMVSSIQRSVAGQLRIACSTTAGKYILPRLAARFRKRFPHINVSILSCTSEYVIPRLLEGEAHLGVVSYEAFRSGLDIQEFFEDHIALIVPKDHPWAAQEVIEPSDLIDEPLINRESTSGTRRVLLEELAKHDISIDDLNIFLELGNAEAIVETVAAGYGVAFVSRLATACLLERETVAEVQVAGLSLRRTIYMVRKAIDPPNQPREVFWSFVHDPANADLLQLPESP